VGIDPSGGNFTLEVVHDNLVKQTSALVTQTEVSEITLVYDVEYRLRYQSGHAATDARHLLLRRGYQYDPTSIVGKTTEEDTLTTELRSDAVQQIVRQLSALREDALLPDADPATLPAP
jgi:outer membrane lipopolysaccharide assembly protein LptE/RlpB